MVLWIQPLAFALIMQVAARNYIGSNLRLGDYPASSQPPHPPEQMSIWHHSDFSTWGEWGGYLEGVVRLGHPHCLPLWERSAVPPINSDFPSFSC